MSTPTYTLHVLMAQRRCRYEGEYAPEVLAVADEYAMDENPDYMQTEIRDAQNSGDFSAIRVLAIKVPLKAVDDALSQTFEVNGEVAS